MYFDSLLAYRGETIIAYKGCEGWLFLDRKLLFIDFKLDTHTKRLKNFQRSNNRLFEYNVTFLICSHHISAFGAGHVALTFFVRLLLYSIFTLIFGFLQVSMSFLQERFGLNIYYRNIVLNFGLERVKNHNIL